MGTCTQGARAVRYSSIGSDLRKPALHSFQSVPAGALGAPSASDHEPSPTRLPSISRPVETPLWVWRCPRGVLVEGNGGNCVPDTLSSESNPTRGARALSQGHPIVKVLFTSGTSCRDPHCQRESFLKPSSMTFGTWKSLGKYVSLNPPELAPSRGAGFAKSTGCHQ